MPNWQYVLASATGGELASLTTATDRTMTFKLTEPSEAAFKINGRSSEAAAVAELATDLIAVRDGQRLYRGRIGSTSDSLDLLTHSVDVSTLDYREVLNRRLLAADDPFTFGGIDQAQIVWSLLTSTQGRPGGNLNIVQGAGMSSGTMRSRTYTYGDVIGSLIGELSQLIDGFDWDISPVDGTTMRLDMWHGTAGRGSDKGVVLEYGGLVSGVKRDVDVSTYANAVRVTGADGTLVELREAADLADKVARPEGRFEGLYGYPEVAGQSQLAERANWQIADSQVIRPTYSLNLKAGAWQGPQHIWLGDTVTVRIKSGRLNVDTQLRVYEIAVTPGALGTETVAITAGGSRPDYRRRPLDVLRRLRTLENR